MSGLTTNAEEKGLTTNAQEKSESLELSVQELETVTGGFLGRIIRTGQLQPQGTVGAILVG